MWRNAGQRGGRAGLRAVADTHVLAHQWSLGMGIDPSGRFLIADGEPARIWDTASGRCVLTVPGSEPIP